MTANPTSPTVVDGNADFSSLGDKLLVSTTSDRTIIDWDDFSIQLGEATQFIQPALTSAILNRVTSSNPSDIIGSLSSNGNVFLLNPNGILVGETGKIDVGGLLLSTLEVSNSEFLAGGDMTFSGNSLSVIENRGSIEGNTDAVYLLGRHIVNAGDIAIINDSTSNVILGAGSSIVLRTSSKDIVINPITDTPSGTGVDQSGHIMCNRAEVRADGNLYTLAIRQSGGISATQTGQVGGEVYLVAENGETLLDGQASLSAENASSGGRVHVLGQTVTLQDQASITTRNDHGGGEIFIGGSMGGLDPDIPNAVTTSVGPGVEIDSSARISGFAGDVSVFATGVATFEGNIDATGGIAGGGGATVEISGISNLAFTGLVDTRGFGSGTDGLLILDPTDIIISGGATAGGSFDGGSPLNTFSGSAAAAILNSGDLNTALQTNNVLVTTTSGFASAGNITIGANTTLNLLATSHTLTLNADNNIQINFDFTMIDSAQGTSVLNLTAGNDINVADPLTGTSLASINLSAGNDINLTDNISAVGATLNMTSGVDINSSGGTPILTAEDINFSAGDNFTVTSALIFAGGGSSSDLVGTAVTNISSTADIIFNNWNDATLSTTTGDILIGDEVTANNVATLTFDSANDLVNQTATNTFLDSAGNMTDLFLNAERDILIDTQIDINNFNSATLNAGRDFLLENDFEPDGTTTVTVNADRNIVITDTIADVIALNGTTLTFAAGNDYTASEPFTVINVDNVNISAGNDITITTPSGQTNVTGADTTVTAGNDITINETFISNAAGDISFLAGNDLNLGPSTQVSQIGSRLGNVSIETGRDLNITGGTGTNDRSQIGFSASVVDSDIELTIGRDLNLLGGSGTNTPAFIGHGFVSPGVYNGDIIIHSVGRNVTLTGQQVAGGANRFAQIGHVRQSGGTSTFTGDIRGSTVGSPARILGDLTLNGGAGVSKYAHIGHGGGRNTNANDTYSGEIRVQANSIALNGGTAADCNASIGFFAVAQGGGINPVSVTSDSIVQVISDTTLDMTASTNGTVSIGSFVLNSAAHPAVVTLDLVDVQTGGDLTMLSGSGGETQAFVGAFSTFATSVTDLSMDIGGDLIMTSGTGASANILNGVGSTAATTSTVTVSGNITPTVTGASPAFIEAVTGDLTVTAGGTISLPALTRIDNVGGSNGDLGVQGGSIIANGGGFIENMGTGITVFRTTSGDVSVFDGSFITSIGDLLGASARDIILLDNALINTTAGAIDITAGRDIMITAAAGGSSSMESSGSGRYLAGRDISLFGVSAAAEGFIENSSGDLQVFAGADLDVNFFGRVENLGPGTLTLVVDNLFPMPPERGPGSFILSSLGTVGRLGAGPLRIFTSERSLNSIEGVGNLNGETFAPGTLFVGSATEQWGTYFPSSFGGVPFTVFYKNLPVPTPSDILAIDPNAFIPFAELFYLIDGYGMDPAVAWLYEVRIFDGCKCYGSWRLPPYFRKLELKPHYTH
ncbi:MAG: filamentous hemagglutinin N-terminal domain-containing protein [Simkaniaceae bacterium]|nr:filamentous hemagglutinin N-terminal domain-containing protein [Candidatus Sacchlamyda saccharinae]